MIVISNCSTWREKLLLSSICQDSGVRSAKKMIFYQYIFKGFKYFRTFSQVSSFHSLVNLRGTGAKGCFLIVFGAIDVITWQTSIRIGLLEKQEMRAFNITKQFIPTGFFCYLQLDEEFETPTLIRLYQLPLCKGPLSSFSHSTNMVDVGKGLPHPLVGPRQEER